MKLLIVTQKVDRADPILGFFHGWIAAFAGRCAQVTVIGQRVGSHALPGNVHVVSLGKEGGSNRLSQILRFWKLQWSLRGDYDVVLVHMTPIWIVLGAPLWLLLGKRMYLWYEARGTRWPLRVALCIVRKVFSASSTGMPLRTSKSITVGHGIDTALFTSSSAGRDRGLLVTVGRVTKAKHFDVILRAVASLPSSYRLTLVGGPITTEDQETFASLQHFITENDLSDRVNIRSLTQNELVPLLQRADFFLHASTTGLDKALLEAMACGCLAVSSAEAAQTVLPKRCMTTEEAMAERVEVLMNLSDAEKESLRQELRERVVRDHGLPHLIDRLVSEMS